MTTTAFPKRILLATDLSHRCDRALDRAVQLARQWNAGLLVVHAIENDAENIYGYSDLPSWRRTADPVSLARARIDQDLAPESRLVDLSVCVEVGDPATVVLDAAAREQVDLIVTGVARDETLARLLLGRTVDSLARKSPVPLLVVRDRPHAAYGRIIVSTDFEPSSRHALETTARWFPQANFTLFHATNVPYVGYAGADEREARGEELGEADMDSFLQAVDIPPSVASGIGRLVERGDPGALLRDFSQQAPRYLTVVGSSRGNFLYEALIGSMARKIMDVVPGDVLLVPITSRRDAD